MSKVHERVVEAQFGPRAKAYVESAVHSQGADLEAIGALAEGADLALDMGAGGGHVSYALARHARRLCEFGRNTRQSLLGANGRGSEHKVGQETMADDISADRLRVGTSPRGELAVAVALAFQFPLSYLWQGSTYTISPHVAADNAAMAVVPDGVTVYRDRPNVAVLRTFSKAYGLAGLRTGFMIAHEPVAAAVRATMLPFTVNRLAQAAAIASLAAEAELLERVERTVKERTRVREALIADGWTVPATEANFVWLRLGEHTSAFAQACDAAGVSVRPFAGEGARVSIGTPPKRHIPSSATPPWPASASLWAGKRPASPSSSAGKRATSSKPRARKASSVAISLNVGTAARGCLPGAARPFCRQRL